MSTDVEAVVYLMLMNKVLHDLFPTVITIGEDVSGMPPSAGGCRASVRAGGMRTPHSCLLSEASRPIPRAAHGQASSRAMACRAGSQVPWPPPDNCCMAGLKQPDLLQLLAARERLSAQSP